MAEQYQVAFNSRGCDLAQAVGLGLGAFLQRGDLLEIALEQLLERGRLGLGAGLEGLGLWVGPLERLGQLIDQSLAL